jgi:hypothetical protein
MYRNRGIPVPVKVVVTAAVMEVMVAMYLFPQKEALNL